MVVLVEFYIAIGHMELADYWIVSKMGLLQGQGCYQGRESASIMHYSD